MSYRANQLATRFAALNDEIITAVDGCDDNQWSRISPEEGWPLRVVAHHIASAHAFFAGTTEALASDADPFVNFSFDDVHRHNAEHARAHATVGKDETLAALRTNGAVAERAIRALSDAQLDRLTPLPDGREISVADVVDSIVIGHPAGHLASIRATFAMSVAAAD